MDLILYGDIFCHNIITHLDLKGLSKLKCVCKRYGQIITKTLVKQLTINKIKSELIKVYGNNYDEVKKKFCAEKMFNKNACKSKYYLVIIWKIPTILNAAVNFINAALHINGTWYGGDITCRKFLGFDKHFTILQILDNLNVKEIKYKIYSCNNPSTKYYFLENETNEPFEIGDHL
jgi:hypothetical protein